MPGRRVPGPLATAPMRSRNLADLRTGLRRSLAPVSWTSAGPSRGPVLARNWVWGSTGGWQTWRELIRDGANLALAELGRGILAVAEPGLGNLVLAELGRGILGLAEPRLGILALAEPGLGNLALAEPGRGRSMVESWGDLLAPVVMCCSWGLVGLEWAVKFCRVVVAWRL